MNGECKLIKVVIEKMFRGNTVVATYTNVDYRENKVLIPKKTEYKFDELGFKESENSMLLFDKKDESHYFTILNDSVETLSYKYHPDNKKVVLKIYFKNGDFLQLERTL